MHNNRYLMVITLVVIAFLIDIYAYQGVRFVIRNWSITWQWVARISYWSVSAVVLVMTLGILFGLLDTGSRIGRSVYFGAFFLNVFPKLVLLLFVFFDDVVRAGKWMVSLFQREDGGAETPGEPITRSDFILKTGMVAASIPFLGTSWGIISGAHDYRIRRKTIVLPNLPRQFDGITVAQLSDIHSGSFFNKTAVKGGVEMLLAEKPDITFFTGDLVNDKANEVNEFINIFDKVKSPLGVYSILGNHDYGDYVSWSSAEAKRKNLIDLHDAHQALGWNLMLNENQQIKVDGESIGLIGVENWGVGFVQHGDIARAYEGMQEMPVKILLSHDPTHWDAQIRPEYADIDLMLAGHTHGMQMGIKVGDFEWSPSKWRYKQWGGHYQEGNQHLYVNRGFGFIGLPARIGMAPEITIITLKKSGNA